MGVGVKTVLQPALPVKKIPGCVTTSLPLEPPPKEMTIHCCSSKYLISPIPRLLTA
jgi:hypothetical protein